MITIFFVLFNFNILYLWITLTHISYLVSETAFDD